MNWLMIKKVLETISLAITTKKYNNNNDKSQILLLFLTIR